MSLFRKYEVPREFDLLSIDVDGNGYYIWAAACGAGGYRPRVVVIEHNSSYRPPDDRVMAYDSSFGWDRKSVYFGASAQAMWALGARLGYRLVHIESSGTNMFFVRNDVATDAEIRSAFGDIAASGDVAALYRPPAYGPGCQGHIGPPPPGHRWISPAVADLPPLD